MPSDRALASRGLAGPCPAGPARCPPHEVVTGQWPSRALGRDKRISVLAPPGRPAHRVLVLLHGYGGSSRTWLERTRLRSYVRGTDLLVVLPESGRRWFINDHAGNRYEDYLIGEVIPYVRDAFDVVPGARGWAIGGFSMGGAAALMQALRHPGKFSVVISHAGAFGAPQRRGDPYERLRAGRRLPMPTTEVHERVWGPFGSETRRRYDPGEMIRAWPGAPALSVYADVGVADYPRIIQMNRDAMSALRAARVDLTYAERDGAHDLQFLDSALPFSLNFALTRLSAAAGGTHEGT